MNPAREEKMITPEEEAYVLEKAYVPEHIVSLMALISKGDSVWQDILDIDLLTRLVKAGSRKKAKTLLLNKMRDAERGNKSKPN